MKPVGLTDPKTGKRAFAVIQLRAENQHKTAFNLVGFQTKLKYPEQKRIFTKLPGLEEVEFLRLGSMHKNTYIDSPRLLRPGLQFKEYPNIFIAGQLSGTEGYLESSATGLIAGLNAVRYLKGEGPIELPQYSILGALLEAITERGKIIFQPTNVNMGLLPPLPTRIRNKKERNEALGLRSKKALEDWTVTEEFAHLKKPLEGNYRHSDL